jgi:hypothetical protein
MALPLETGPPGETRERAEDRAAGASHGFLAPAVGAHREHGRATSQTDGARPKARPFHLIHGGALWHSARPGGIRRADTP